MNNDSSSSTVFERMWDTAYSIGDEDSTAQPYVVLFWGSWGGHAVVCYGTEEGDWNAGDGNHYTKRLLIADPNSEADASDGTHIYISDDDTSVWYDGGLSIVKIGFEDTSLSTLNTYDYFDAAANRQFEVSAKETTDLELSIGDGKAVIIAGELVLVEDVTATTYNSMDIAVSSTGNRHNRTLYRFDTNDKITVSPKVEGGSLNTLLSYGGYSVRLTSGADSITMSKDGDIIVNGATGDFTMELSRDGSAFGFITVNGKADGDVSISIKDDKLDVYGDISDYEVVNREMYSKSSDADGAEKQATRFIIEDGKIVALIDKDGDGEFETRYEKGPSIDVPDVPVVFPGAFTVEDGDTHHSASSSNAVKADAAMRSWKHGSILDLDFKQVKVSDDLKVYVDNNLLVIEQDYMIVNGVLLLKQEYLNTLTIGTHTLTTSDGYSEVFRIV